jgi:hypothetical protein
MTPRRRPGEHGCAASGPPRRPEKAVGRAGVGDLDGVQRDAASMIMLPITKSFDSVQGPSVAMRSRRRTITPSGCRAGYDDAPAPAGQLVGPRVPLRHVYLRLGRRQVIAGHRAAAEDQYDLPRHSVGLHNAANAIGRPEAGRSRSQAGYRLGSDRGSPNDGSTLFSKRVMAEIRSPVSVSTKRPIPWLIPVGVRR